MPENVQPSDSDRPQEAAAAAAPQQPAEQQPAAANDATGAAATAAAQPDAQAQLATLQARNTELNEQFLRAQAEMQNVRRRAEEEVAKARKFAVDSFAENLLPVCDSLEAGLAHQDASVQQIREGAEATLRQLRAALERNKVLEINPAAGTKFDPHQHQAISMVPTDQEANTVVSVLQKGYSIADRILRPALVIVAAPRS